MGCDLDRNRSKTLVVAFEMALDERLDLIRRGHRLVSCSAYEPPREGASNGASPPEVRPLHRALSSKWRSSPATATSVGSWRLRRPPTDRYPRCKWRRTSASYGARCRVHVSSATGSPLLAFCGSLRSGSATEGSPNAKSRLARLQKTGSYSSVGPPTNVMVTTPRRPNTLAPS